MATIEGIEGIGKIQKIGARAVPKARRPRKRRRYPLLDVAQETPRERLERKITHAYPGTLPERLVIQWCVDNNLAFQTQWRLYGSRTMWRSIRVDIVVFLYKGIVNPLAIRVHGNYWHRSPGKKYADDVQARDLTAAGYLVVDCWEADVLDAAMNDRMYGYMEDQIYSARR